MLAIKIIVGICIMFKYKMKLDNRLLKYKEKMESTILSLEKELSSIRTGRANPTILENIKVEAYNNIIPINQVASISVLDPRTLSVNVWDRAVVKATADAIRDCGMNFNPQVEGQNIRVTLVPLTQERRNELCKAASKLAENYKITLRNIRHDALDYIKNLEKTKEITEDIKRKLNDDIQNLLNEFNSIVDKKVKDKQDTILEI